MWNNKVFEMLAASFAAVIVAAVGFGMLLMWGVSKMWDMAKPLIHALTA